MTTYEQAQRDARHARSEGPATRVNTSQGERMLSAVGGLAFLTGGVAKRGWLGVGLASVGADLLYRAVTGFSLVYHLLGKNRAVVSETAAVSVPHGAGIRVEESITINRPPGELYSFWRDFRNLSLFMENVESVTIQDDGRSHWVVKGPAGMNVEWDAEIVNEEPDEKIAWRTVDSALVDHAGTVHFRSAPGDRGTELHVELEYVPAAGKLGALIAKLFQRAPGQQITADLRNLKQLLEAGEVATVDGQPSGRK